MHSGVKIKSHTHPGLTKKGYLPTLDGWRAIAILSVIAYHDRLHSFGPFSTRWLNEYGSNGVDLFFVISGLLICTRLLEEESIFERISLRKFYIRRACRILPAALFFLCVIAVLAIIGVFHIGIREWLGALLFFHNYSSLLGPLGPDSIFLDHFWSLAVEEHFYCILPAVLVLTRKKWRLPVLLGLTLLVEIHRLSILQSRPWVLVGVHTGVRLDYLIIPAIFAVILQRETYRDLLKRWLRIWPLLLATIAILISFWRLHAWQIAALPLLMTTTILGSVLNPEGLLAQVLESKPLAYIGRISYSIYLWQEIFIAGHFYTGGYPLGILQRTSLRYVATFALALGSYYLIERPMIRLGHRLAPPATPGRDDIDVTKKARRTDCHVSRELAGCTSDAISKKETAI